MTVSNWEEIHSYIYIFLHMFRWEGNLKWGEIIIISHHGWIRKGIPTHGSKDGGNKLRGSQGNLLSHLSFCTSFLAFLVSCLESFLPVLGICVYFVLCGFPALILTGRDPDAGHWHITRRKIYLPMRSF